MSYVTMDHAGWVENNNAAHNRMRRNRKGFKAAPEKLNPLQTKVMDILGITLGGIYNAPISWDKVDWDYGWGAVSVIVRDDRFATFDFHPLTAMVFLCHEARIRCQFEAHTRGYLRLSFSQRTHEGSMSCRHPSLDEAVAAFRGYFPADHPLHYQATMDAPKKDAA